MSKPKIIAVVGPTASGKTSLAIDIAKQFAGEIISADSRQVYRGMDIGTSKVTKEEMAGVPHHLLDIADPTEVYTGTDFVRDAGAVIDEVNRRARVPIIAGGTFFYIDLLRGRMNAAPVAPDSDFRQSLTHYSDTELFELLTHKDPRRAATIDPHNRRRLIRALEIIKTLGAVPTLTTTDSSYNWLIIGINIDKETLASKFRARLTEWLEIGLVNEVEKIRSTVSPDRFREFGFEYTLTADYIDQKINEAELFDRFVEKNWQYAKRQMTWLKKDSAVEWFKPKTRQPIFDRVAQFLERDS